MNRIIIAQIKIEQLKIVLNVILGFDQEDTPIN